MKASALVCSVRARIGDTGGTIIGDGPLLELLNSALCEHAQLRPELYTVSKVAKLSEGTVQTADCCSTILSVDMLTSKDGTSDYGPIRTVNSAASMLFVGRCGGKNVGSDTVPSSATIDPRVPGQFKLQPPVKKNQKLWARITCVQTPELISGPNCDVEVSCKNFEDLITFIISKLYVPGDADINAKAAAEREYYYKGNNARRQIGYQVMRAVP